MGIFLISAVESFLAKSKNGELGVTGEGTLLDNAPGKKITIISVALIIKIFVKILYIFLCGLIFAQGSPRLAKHRDFDWVWIWIGHEWRFQLLSLLGEKEMKGQEGKEKIDK